MSKKVVLLEDDPLLIDIYQTKLKEKGFEVVVIDRGEGAVEKIQKEVPDLVMLDIVLPNMDGWQILRQLRADENLKAMQIVVLSNLGQKEEVEKGLTMGAAKYLIKAHYTPTQVVQEVQNVLANAQSGPQNTQPTEQ